MGSYSKIALNDAIEIFKLYGLGTPISLIPLSLGISNSNYKVEFKDKVLLLKISNDKSQEQLEDEQKILNYLASCDFHYSVNPIPLEDGQLIYRYQDYFGVIYPFREGIPPGPSDQTCLEIGVGLAKLHSVPNDRPEYLTLRNHQDVGFGGKLIESYTQNTNCPSPYKDYFYKIFPNGVEDLTVINWKEGIIHGDLYYDNTLFDHNKLSSILDFEQAGRGPVVLDIGICISGTCLEKGRIIKPLIESFLEGYESVRPLPAKEREHLNSAIIIGLFSISLWRIKRFTEGNLNPRMADSYLELLQRALTFSELIKE